MYNKSVLARVYSAFQLYFCLGFLRLFIDAGDQNLKWLMVCLLLCLKDGLNPWSNNQNNICFHLFIGHLDSNNTDKLPPEDAYPVMAKPSPSLQIIATRNRPCCECIRYNQRAQPLCLLFLIFIVVSCSLITGVMFYLKSGTYNVT